VRGRRPVLSCTVLPRIDDVRHKSRLIERHEILQVCISCSDERNQTARLPLCARETQVVRDAERSVRGRRPDRRGVELGVVAVIVVVKTLSCYSTVGDCYLFCWCKRRHAVADDFESSFEYSNVSPIDHCPRQVVVVVVVVVVVAWCIMELPVL